MEYNIDIHIYHDSDVEIGIGNMTKDLDFRAKIFTYLILLKIKQNSGITRNAGVYHLCCSTPDFTFSLLYY